MAEFKYEVIRKIGAIEKGIEFRTVSWGDNPEKYDLRKWYAGYNGEERCAKGVTFNAQEGKEIASRVDELLSGNTPSGIVQGRSEIKVQLTKYGYDIGVWSNAYRLKGVTFTSEGIKTLQSLLNDEFGTEEVKVRQEVKKEVAKPAPKTETIKIRTGDEAVIHSLTSIPVNDGNYPIKTATIEQLEKAIEIMENEPNGHHKTRLARCKAKLNQLKKGGIKEHVEEKKSVQPAVVEEKPVEIKTEKVIKFEKPAEVTEEKEHVEAKSKDKNTIIQFPKKDTTEIKKLAPTGEHHSYEEAEAKLNKEREMFKGDRDSNYVIDGILEACVSDQEFLDNVMRPEKSYVGAFQYFANKAKEGYCMKIGSNIGVMDADTALKYAIDYFNSEEPKKAAPKQKETKTTTIKKTVKRGAKKKAATKRK